MSTGHASPYFLYIRKSFYWTVGNGILGLFPLIFLLGVNAASQYKIASKEIYELIHSGVVLFVCTSLMGAVVVEYIISDHKAKSSTFATILFVPGAVLYMVSIDYLLAILKITDGSCFDLTSVTTIVITVLCMFYSIFIKAYLYIKENFKNENS